MKKVDAAILDRAQSWLGPAYDESTRKQVKALIDSDPDGLIEAFYCDLEFGTGGLRGIMGPGTNRMNQYTVGMATQGLANYLLQSFPEIPEKAVAIAHDCRNNSRYFTEVAASVLSANGIKVYLFDDLRPTPLLSFAVRELKCQSGIVITASHNPPEYNGYKVYWNDGGQLVPPHDKNVIREVRKITGMDQVRTRRVDQKIVMLGAEIDRKYLERMKAYSLSPENNIRHHDLKIVFTPIHGSAVRLAPQALNAFGFDNIFHVPEQDVTSGDFPTVSSPNPEEPAALKMALDLAREVDADLVMATDPDADRVGVAVKNLRGEFILLNGNQTATIILAYLLHQWKEKGLLTGNEYIVKTIVTSELLRVLSAKYGVECYDVLTGFKYIAELIQVLEGRKTFIAGGEESYGYLVGDYVRDKDAIISCCFVAEAAAWARQNGKTLYQMLVDVYLEHGLYLEKLVNITRKGKSGLEEIKALMENFRTNPPGEVHGIQVVEIKDFKKSITKNLHSGTETNIDLPQSDVLQFFLADGSKISIRPSGTEPKIKFYFGAKGTLETVASLDVEMGLLENKITGFVAALNLS